MAFVDTMGTLIGVSARANLLDERGNLPQIEKPMLADALSTILASLLGTTTAGVYIESAAGIEGVISSVPDEASRDERRGVGEKLAVDFTLRDLQIGQFRAGQGQPA